MPTTLTADLVKLTHHLFIGGKWVTSASAENVPVINPATEEIIADSVAATAADVVRAVAAARAAFPAWSAMPPADRAAVLARAYDLYKTKNEEIAHAITTEMGAPISATRKVHAGYSGELLRLNAEMARTYPYEQREDDSLIVREAYGVIGAITPWNNPVYMQLMKAAPAIAAGCTVVDKPAESSPLSGYIVTEILRQAGVPAGVYNFVTGTGAVVGSAIDGHPGIDMVSFTGSIEAGAKVAELAARHATRTVLELGGKSACLVLDNADLAAAVAGAMQSAFNNAGQMCGTWTRVVVPRAQLRRATELAVSIAEVHVVGNPMDERTTIGPIANARQRDTILKYIRTGIDEGAKLASGGPERPKGMDRGYYVRPTVLTNVDNRMRVAQEEIFGPVLAIIPHDGDEDAIRLANDSLYGLREAVWSSDDARALAVARQLRTGQDDLNGYKMSLTTPFGGYKQSGYGRCQGRFGFEEYLQIKSIQL